MKTSIIVSLMLTGMLMGCAKLESKPVPQSAFLNFTSIKAFGDSITAGHGSIVLPDGTYDGYAYMLSQQLGLPIANTAVPGSKLGDDVQIEAIRETIPDPSTLYIILTGVNDMAHDTNITDYEALLREAIDHLTAKGSYFFVGNCIKVPEQSYDDGSDAIVASYNKVIANAVSDFRGQGRNVFLVDATDVYDPTLMVSSDETHPSLLGHHVLEAAFYSAIEAVLEETNE